MAVAQKGPTIEDRLATLEDKLASIESAIETHMSALGQTLIDVKTNAGTDDPNRLAKLEELLERHGIRLPDEPALEEPAEGEEVAGDQTPSV